MTALDPETSALVATEVAALRRAGWASGKAVELVASLLPAGSGKAQLLEVASSLAQARPASGADPLVAMLALGDRAGPDALDEAASAALAEVEGRQSFWNTLAPGVGFLAFCAALLVGSVLLSRVYTPFREMIGTYKSAVTSSRSLMAPILYGGLVLVGALVISIPFLVRSWAMGAKLHRAAASLRRFAALLSAGVQESEAAAWIGAPPGVSPFEGIPGLPSRTARFAEWLSAGAGRAVAARTLAEELELAGRFRDRVWSIFLPMAGFLILVLIVLPFVFAVLVLPILRMVQLLSAL